MVLKLETSQSTWCKSGPGPTFWNSTKLNVHFSISVDNEKLMLIKLQQEKDLTILENMRDVATCYHFKLMLPIKTVRRDVEWNGGQGLFEFKPPTTQLSGTKISSDHMHQWKYAVWAWFTEYTCSLPECQIYQVRGRLIVLMLAFILTPSVKWRFGLDVCPSTQTAQLSGFLQIDCNTLHSVPEFMMLCTKRGHTKKNIRSQTAANKTF